MTTLPPRLAAVLLPLTLLFAQCGSETTSAAAPDTTPSDASPLETTPSDVASTDGAPRATDTGAMADIAADVQAADMAVDTYIEPGTASYKVQGSVSQVFVTHATPGEALELRATGGEVIASGKADALGSLVLRKVAPGTGYKVFATGATPEPYSSPVAVVAAPSSLPPQSFYANQTLTAGYGYLTVRDGTTLAYWATLPGPESDGPYPTVVNYSGYAPARPGQPIVSGDQTSYCAAVPVLCAAPSDPNALLLAVGGYATVSVNIRGTGCSGGAYDYFEELQLLDGYDVLEIVAAQPWVKHHKVGMTGLSYPGITQLFVAKTQPPSLSAIAPQSVIGNTATTLVPGGMLNDGFALSWIEHVYNKAAPYGQGWEQKRVDGGDTICKENQLLHDQRVNNVDQAKDTANYVPSLMTPLNPSAWAGAIQVPVFLSGSWQDEQTGPFFTTLLDKLTASPSRRFILSNGIHADGFAPQVVAELKAFFDLYVAQEVPSQSPFLELLAPEFTKNVAGVPMNLPPSRWTTFKTHAEALAQWQKEPELRVIFENGAGTDVPGAPQGTFAQEFGAWPPPQTQLERWYLHAGGALLPDEPTETGAASRFKLDPTAGERTMKVQDIWKADAKITWKKPDAGFEIVFVSPPLAEDRVYVGTGSVDLWIRTNDADVTDADLEVNLTEVRPDGQERYVQSGWLRASFRTLSPLANDLWPEPTMVVSDVAPLEPGNWTLVRVAIAGFAHPFRKGSRILLAIDTPGDSRAEWLFDLKTFPHEVAYDIAHAPVHPSSLALPLIPAAKIPAGATLPPCPSLRGQPCRTFVETANTPAQI